MIEYDSMAVPFAFQALHAAPLGAGQHADAGHKECAKLPISVKRKEMEASTGIEPVYTDLQSAASPLRQLAARGCAFSILVSRGVQAAVKRILYLSAVEGKG